MDSVEYLRAVVHSAKCNIVLIRYQLLTSVSKWDNNYLVIEVKARPEAIMLKTLPIMLFHNSLEIVTLFPNCYQLFSHLLLKLTQP